MTIIGGLDRFIDKLVINNRQLTKLKALRDTILPKLMSGEVRVEI